MKCLIRWKLFFASKFRIVTLLYSEIHRGTSLGSRAKFVAVRGLRFRMLSRGSCTAPSLAYRLVTEVFAPLAYGHKELAETAVSGHTGNRSDWVSGLLIVVSSVLRFLHETVTSILCGVCGCRLDKSILEQS